MKYLEKKKFSPWLARFALSDLLNENIKQHFQVSWSSHMLRVKLNTAPIQQQRSSHLLRATFKATTFL